MQVKKGAPLRAIYSAILLVGLSVVGTAFAQSQAVKSTQSANNIQSTTTANNTSNVSAQADANGAALIEKKEGRFAIKDAMVEREELVAKHGKYSGTIVGLFPGTVSNADALRYYDRYLPLLNHMSQYSDSLVSFIPEPSVAVLKRRVAEQRYSILYVNAEVAGVALEKGYEPIVKRSSPITSVMLVRSDSSWKTVKDADKQKVGVIDQAMVTSIAKASFEQNNLTPNIQKTASSGQDELIVLLQSKLVDGVVLRKETAEALLKKEENKGYKIGFELGTVPGFILMADSSVPQALKAKLGESLMYLKKGDPYADRIFKGMDGTAAGFEPSSREEIAKLVSLFKATEAFDKKNNIGAKK